MSQTKIYVGESYRQNLINYWKQYFPNYKIPNGYHVHHIKPRCTFEDKNDPGINHPSNLIALHPDDHVAIHRCRGDKFINDKLILSVKGNKLTAAQKEKLRTNRLGAKYSDETKKKMSNAKKAEHILKHIDRICLSPVAATAYTSAMQPDIDTKETRTQC